MPGELAVLAKGDSVLYERMHAAIVNCYSVDDCREIADQSSAIAAYYKQIKDDDSVRRFLSVKIRAWRRIGEICSQVDVSMYDTKTAGLRKVQHIFPQLSQSQVYNAMRLAELPADFFEDNADDGHSISSMISAYSRFLLDEWQSTPEGQKEIQSKKEALEAETERQKKQKTENRKEQESLDREWREVTEGYVEAVKEIGYTMDRRDRKKVKSVVLLLQEPLHTTLRQAAFDVHKTMQQILRDGLVGWLASHGYKFDGK